MHGGRLADCACLYADRVREIPAASAGRLSEQAMEESIHSGSSQTSARKAGCHVGVEYPAQRPTKTSPKVAQLAVSVISV